MAGWWGKWIPSKNDRELRRLAPLVEAIGAHEERLRTLSEEELQAQTPLLQNRYAANLAKENLPDDAFSPDATPEERKRARAAVDRALAPLLTEAFATTREASRRVLGLRHYDAQMLGGIILHEGKIAEMKTGEGKTLVATLPVYLNALAGRGVHVVTVNEYLASRDAEWMGKLYRYLGFDCGIIANGLSDAARKAAYLAPITYGTNSEFGFDYLRDNMKLSIEDYVQRGSHFAIVDEVDSILIDEARTPLIISGPSEDSTEKYARIDGLIPGLMREQDYTVDEKARSVVLTEGGVRRIEQRLGVDNLYEPVHIELLHHVNQGLRAHTLYRRDVDYMVEEGKVKIIDEFTGRVLDGRRWSDGLHQAVEAKEGVRIESENQTLATITYQNYFRGFLKLGGMTGTAQTEAEEFAKIYDLDVVAIPTHRAMVRQDDDDVVYKTEQEKFKAIAKTIVDAQSRGQPCLVGTISVEKSEVLSRLLKQIGVAHTVLNAKYHRQEAEIIAQAGRLKSVTIATNMAGRGTDILLGGNPSALARQKMGAAEAENAEAYAKLLATCEAACQQEKQAVIDAGGLFILGTERHESRRIDNQLRGRSGRQGDPGRSRFFLSLSDDLMRIFGGGKLMQWMERLGMEEDEVIEHSMVNNAIENAQRGVEGHNFDVRKHLLEYDDVMNDQRRAVYKLRRRVLSASVEGSREMVKDLIEEVIINSVARHCPEKTGIDAWDLTGLQTLLSEQFAMPVSASQEGLTSREDLETRLYEQVDAGLMLREDRFTPAALYHVTRILFLQTVDMLWKDHLREMDQLREGISLRGYAQKDPKQEYKKEGYNLFAAMMATIAADVLMKVFRVVITSESEAAYQARVDQQARQRAHQLEAQRTTQARQALPPGAADGPDESATPARRGAGKVGRNDLCPCGSGKKYKKCHMAEDETVA